MYELLYADDLVLLGRSLEELENKMSMWKDAIEKKGLKMNTKKTKWLKVTGRDISCKTAMSDPCSVCRKTTRCNVIRCTLCNK